MTKNMILATAAVGVLAFAGAASAHDLTYRAGPVVGAIDLSDTNSATGPGNAVAADQDLVKYNRSLVGLYLVAEEALGTTLGSGTLALTNPLTAGAQLPSGNNLYTITLTNGTFGTAVTTAALVGANCTSALSSGGGANQSTVTFLVSTSGGSCNGFSEVNLPIKPTAAGTVTVTTNYTTEAGTPIDGAAKSLDAIYAVDAFQPAFNSTLTTAGAGTDTFALIGPAVAGGNTYTTLSGDTNIGKTAIYVDVRAQRNLTPGNFVATTDVTDATVIVTGDFTAFDGAAGTAGNPVLTTGNGAAAAITATLNAASTVATFAAAQANVTQSLAIKPAGSAVTVTADGGQIPASAYNASLSFTLAPASFAAQAGASGAFETIEREGTNFIAPWTGGSQAQSQSVIRLSSTGTASGSVFVQLTNAYTSGNVAIADPVSCNVGSVPAAGDLVIGQPALKACFGDFLRGDLLITVEGASAQLTAKMRNITPNSTGGTFETTLGRYSGSTIAGAAQ